MLLIILELILGCVLLAWSADRFIRSSMSLAQLLKLSPLVIGLIFVGFGTSFPEMVVSAIASIHGKPIVGIGNAIGSNIINVGFVLSIVALITPLKVHSRVLKQEMPILFVIIAIAGILLAFGVLNQISGLILILVLAAYLFWLFRFAPDKEDILVEEIKSEIKHPMSPKKATFWWIASLVLVYISSELFVAGASGLAKIFHISDLVIGLTIVAMGTSLPELAASLAAIRHNEPDIAVGNIIGSNIFNLLAVLAMPAFIAPTKIPHRVLTRDYPVMIGFCVALWLFTAIIPKRGRLERFFAALLLLGFSVYIYFLI